jgi:hypothetical protein
MGLLDIILGIFGGKQKPVDFGKVNPDDIEAYWRVDHDVDQAERKGAGELAAALAKWGLRDMAHWEQVKAALVERHGDNPEFSMAASRVGYELQAQNMAGSYQMPPQYSTPPHGVTLDRYAAIKARLDLGQALAAILPEYQLDPARWQEVDATWSGRMGPHADAFAGQILRSTYHGMYQQAAAAYGRK